MNYLVAGALGCIYAHALLRKPSQMAQWLIAKKKSLVFWPLSQRYDFTIFHELCGNGVDRRRSCPDQAERNKDDHMKQPTTSPALPRAVLQQPAVWGIGPKYQRPKSRDTKLEKVILTGAIRYLQDGKPAFVKSPLE